jgi:hypothetical protein
MVGWGAIANKQRQTSEAFFDDACTKLASSVNITIVSAHPVPIS